MIARETQVLVVEDDDDTREALAIALEGEGYRVHTTSGVHEAGRVVAAVRPDLVVLDVRLGDGTEGFGIARKLRSTMDVPVLFLSGLDTLESRLTGFEVGGDDYLTKPFAMEELLVRVRALLRRAGRRSTAVWEVGDLVVDEAGRRVTRGGEELFLTFTEFELLLRLCRRPGRVVSKRQLLGEVWGADWFSPNVVEVRISDLRRKLEAHGPRLIHTVRGVGYVLRP
jgi:two-component system, OmpR family, response regulator